jgi:peptidoglycan lytic transglycosylase F
MKLYRPPFCILVVWLACGFFSCSQTEHKGHSKSTERVDAGDEIGGSGQSRRIFSSAANEPPKTIGDLAEIRTRGELRILVLRHEFLDIPREGGELAADLTRVEVLADKLGLQPRFITVDGRSGLFEALKDGRGDIIGTLLRPDSLAEGVTYSTAVRHVDDVLVARRGERNIPRTIEKLNAFKIFMPDLPETTSAIKKIEKVLEKKLDVVEVHGDIESDDILDGVGSGRYGMTIARSDKVERYLSYRDDVEVHFVLQKQVPLAWATVANAPNLIDAVNGFIYEYALTPHLKTQFGGDLREIRKRRVIRVAMLNNSVAYYIYRGQEIGFQYELAELLSQRLNIRLEIVVPQRPKDATRLLAEGRADIAVVSPSPNDAFYDKIVFSPPFSSSDQILVQPSDQAPITSLVGLMGKEIHIRRSSQYFKTLQPVSWAVPGLKIVEVSEDLETQDLIDSVGKRTIPLTMANSVLLNSELNYRDDVQGSLMLASNKPLVFAVRKTSPQLHKRINRFVRVDCVGPFYEKLNKKYFSGRKRMQEVRTEALDTSGAISPYDDLARKFGRMYSIDWRLIVAQMYKESHFDPKALSWAGARGLLQVMPQTGRELGFKDLWDPEANLHAGVKYLAQLLNRFEITLPMRQRVRFAMAAYNAGLGHVRDARRLAWRLGYDPNRWFGHVERAMLLLEKPEYHRQARHGYCRGSEPVQYVSQIQTKYDAYVRLVPAEGSQSSEK